MPLSQGLGPDLVYPRSNKNQTQSSMLVYSRLIYDLKVFDERSHPDIILSITQTQSCRLIKSIISKKIPPSIFHQPSPLPTQNQLDVGPTPLTEHDPFDWDDGIKQPQPLRHEPLWSAWSPESPSSIEELDEMDFDPPTPSSSRFSTASSLWSLESLPDQQESGPSPEWTDSDRNWTTSPDH